MQTLVLRNSSFFAIPSPLTCSANKSTEGRGKEDTVVMHRVRCHSLSTNWRERNEFHWAIIPQSLIVAPNCDDQFQTIAPFSPTPSQHTPPSPHIYWIMFQGFRCEHRGGLSLHFSWLSCSISPQLKSAPAFVEIRVGAGPCSTRPVRFCRGLCASKLDTHIGTARSASIRASAGTLLYHRFRHISPRNDHMT